MWSSIAVVAVILCFGVLGLAGVALAYGWSCHQFYARFADACETFDHLGPAQELPEHWKTLFLEELRRASDEADSILLPSQTKISAQALAGLLSRLRLLYPQQVVHGASVDAWWRFVHARRALDDREAFIQACQQAILASVHVMGAEKPEGVCDDQPR